MIGTVKDADISDEFYSIAINRGVGYMTGSTVESLVVDGIINPG